jgi:hypothetical protein
MGSADNLPLFIFPLTLVIIYLVYLLVRPLPEPKPRAEPQVRQPPMPKDNRGVQHLNYAIGALALLIAVFVVLMPFRDLAHDTWDFSSISGYFPRFKMDSIMGFLVFFCIPAYFIYRFFQKRQHSAAVEAAPEQPFKVNIAVLPMQDAALTKLARGRRMTHMLEMDIQIGIKDWQRIKDAGLYDAVLFSYPDPTSTYSGDMHTCHVRELRQKIAVPFYNLGDAEKAKEEFLKNIVNLRAAVETMKEGPQRTSFEL